MQTFLPYADYVESAKVLDYKRLNKQCLEARQILSSIEKLEKGEDAGWLSHPALIQWCGFKDSLKLYHNFMLYEWVLRGYKSKSPYYPLSGPIASPWWLGNEEYHSSHRAALLAKDPAYYTKFNWTEKPEINYLWPIRCVKGNILYNTRIK